MHLPEALPEYSAVWIIKCFWIARTSRTLWGLLLHVIYAKKSERQIDMFLMYGNLCPLCPPLHWFYYTSHISKHNIGGMVLNKRIQFQWDKEQHWVFGFVFISILFCFQRYFGSILDWCKDVKDRLGQLSLLVLKLVCLRLASFLCSVKWQRSIPECHKASKASLHWWKGMRRTAKYLWEL